MTATLYNGDCLEVMRDMADNSVDLILTDPPYFRVKGEAWDNQWSTPAAFLEWMGLLSEQWQRILKPSGTLYVFASPEMAARVECKIGERFNVLNTITWRKPPYSTKAEMFRKGDLRRYFPASERIIFAEHYGFTFETLRAYLDNSLRESGLSIAQVRDALGFSGNMPFHWFGRGMLRGRDSQWQLPTEVHYTALQGLLPEYFTRSYASLWDEYDELRRPFSVTADVPYTDVWDFPTVQAYPGKHVCEKPAAMMRHIIKASSRVGAVVLDCFMGCGVTGEVARDEGRDFRGIEIDPLWFHRAKRRIQDAEQAARQLIMELTA